MAGIVAILGPLLTVLIVAWTTSPTLALAAGLSVSLLLTMLLLAGGWWLIQHQEETRAALTPEPRTRNPEPRRVLLVEDDPIGRRMATRLLQQLGVQADLAGDGQEAVDIVAANQYALVLMDCEMPVLDGYAATAEIRQREAGVARRLPIIAMTSSTLNADRQRALAAGMDEHLIKPLDLERLTALLVRWNVPHTTVPAVQPAQQPDLPPAPSADQPPILDPAGLPTVNGRISEPYREIVQLFQQEAARRKTALDTALTASDWVQIARIAHTLAGSASSIGALRLAAACSALEVLAKGPASGHPNTDRALAEAVEEVRRELQQAEAALARL